jgi:hypothetical protein
MAKIWKNVECEFYTANTANNYGDSKYLVLGDKMTRTAFVNFKRAPNQVKSENPAIAYLDPNEELYRRIMKTPNDAYITISEVNGDLISICVHPGFVGTCSRKPQEKLVTFDFVNKNGVLSHIHVGHEVKRLKLGRPRRGTVG